MPLYEVWHSQELSEQQQASLADALTTIHGQSIRVPRPFVNVMFLNTAPSPVYMGGVSCKPKPFQILNCGPGAGCVNLKRKFNLIKSYTRQGHTDTQELDDYLKDISAVWKAIVDSTGNSELYAFIVLSNIAAASEYGLNVPGVGAGSPWMKVHMPNFDQRAKDGNQAFQRMLSQSQPHTSHS